LGFVSQNPACRHFPLCGGCQTLDMPYSFQLEAKQRFVEEAFGDFPGVRIFPLLESPVSTGYRHKVQLPFGAVRTGRSLRPLVGCYAQGTHKVVDQSECQVQDPALSRLAWAVRDWAMHAHVPIYHEVTGEGFLRHILLRKGLATGEILLGLVANGPRPAHYRSLVKTLLPALNKVLTESDGKLVGIVQDVNTRLTNVVLGGYEEPWWGRSFLKERIGKHSFHVELSTFLQVNPYQTPRLYAEVARHIPDGGRVLDAYCGMGTITLWLSGKSREVVGVEENPRSIEAARAAAHANGVQNARFVRGDAAVELPRLAGEGWDAVVVDPPRSGLTTESVEALRTGAARRLVYVSCNPQTLLRDARLLSGWRLSEVRGIDMFPHTTHVECVARFDRI